MRMEKVTSRQNEKMHEGRCSVEINRFLPVNFARHLVKSLGIRQYSCVFDFTANKIFYPKTALGT